jgi:hypothetical protein
MKHEDDVVHTSRSSGLFRLEVSRVRVFWSGLNTDGGMARMMHMTSSRWSRGDEAEDE